ncbi:MAG: Cof-type HAD-IIB family hydrolase [Clostridium sp.]|uniref:Cof-type HAD-IIB family hydrolase n=1 Tax=Clostridium sp. TaxID=1506 RepID=UPI003EE4C447
MNLYISDLDGTLLNSSAELSKYTTNIINELILNANINFSIATARTPATVVPLLKNLNLTLPVIVMNGAAMYSLQEQKYIHYNSIPRYLIINIKSILDTHNLSYFTYTLKNNHIYSYFQNPNEFQKKFIKSRTGSPLKTFLDEKAPLDIDTLYFFAMDTKERILSVYEKISKIENISAYAYEDVYEDRNYLLEIFSHKSSKAKAIKILMDNHNFTNLTVFGDNYNDIPMFEMAENKIAVKNAVQKLKEMSTKVIDSNNNDGVVKYLIEDIQKR